MSCHVMSEPETCPTVPSTGSMWVEKEQDLKHTETDSRPWNGPPVIGHAKWCLLMPVQKRSSLPKGASSKMQHTQLKMCILCSFISWWESHDLELIRIPVLEGFNIINGE